MVFKFLFVHVFSLFVYWTPILGLGPEISSAQLSGHLENTKRLRVLVMSPGIPTWQWHSGSALQRINQIYYTSTVPGKISIYRKSHILKFSRSIKAFGRTWPKLAPICFWKKKKKKKKKTTTTTTLRILDRDPTCQIESLLNMVR